MSDEENFDGSQGDSPYLPWIIIAAAIGVLLFFFLRRAVIRLIPVLLVIAIFLPLILYCWRRFKYRDLEIVYQEYDQLTSVLREQGFRTYTDLADRSMGNMLSARDKVENIRHSLRPGDVKDLEAQMESLRKRIELEKDPSNAELLQRNLSECRNNLESFERLGEFLKKYEDSKLLLAGDFKNLRLKIQMGTLVANNLGPSGVPSPNSSGVNEDSPVAPEHRVDEVDRIVSDIENINAIYEKVDKLCE